MKAGENEVLIRVGAFRESVPRPVPDGWDYEKQKFIPGIYDSVELTQSGSPHLTRVQAVPDMEKERCNNKCRVNDNHSSPTRHASL